MTELTRKDLDEVLDRHTALIKEHISLKMQPVNKNLDTLNKTVYGRMGSNGLAGSVKVLKWGYGLFTLGLGILIHKVFM